MPILPENEDETTEDTEGHREELPILPENEVQHEGNKGERRKRGALPILPKFQFQLPILPECNKGVTRKGKGVVGADSRVECLRLI